MHTPGGNLAATESLIYYLREMYGRDIRAIIPQIAMSAGTILACACKSIVMGKHSNLGPIDPQFGAIPAVGVIEEIKRAYKNICKDLRYTHIWNPILSNWAPSFVQQCYWAIERAEEYGKEVLLDNMFADREGGSKLAEETAKKLSDLSANKQHDRHIHYQDAIEIGLNIEILEENPNLQDLVLTVHHCYMHTLSNMLVLKIIENHEGQAFIKMQQT